jgi:alkaline phosphatase D
MSRIPFVLIIFSLVAGCKSAGIAEKASVTEASFTIAFGSCNKNTVTNKLWDDVLSSRPDLWIWGGDIVYADTDDPSKIAKMYEAQKQIQGYSDLLNSVPVIGTWDDHDYGLNDGGAEFASKRESQQVFLDFIGVPEDDPRRRQEGVYASYEYRKPEGSVKILVLDTRYFRTALTPAKAKGKRYEPGIYGEGTLLGEAQWEWLKAQLENSKSDFNIIVSSIQFLSAEHGFETWGNFPHEVDRLKSLIVNSGAKGVIILSGDRHISEFSAISLPALPYPLIDFTSSGLTHVYSGFSGEPNPYRLGEVISTKSFGLLKLNLKNKVAQMQMIGDRGKVLNVLSQQY